jgi:hypothetical protein
MIIIVLTKWIVITITLIKKNLVLEWNVIIIFLIERHLAMWIQSLSHEKIEDFWQYLMIFRELDHSERILSQHVHDTVFSQILMTLRNLVHSEKISFSQVQAEKILSQFVQNTTTILDTVFDFSISVRTISVRTITTCFDSLISERSRFITVSISTESSFWEK